MLKKVIVTNYLGESMVYKITETERYPDKNKLIVFNNQEMRSRNRGVGYWTADNVYNVNTGTAANPKIVQFVINRDSYGALLSITVKGENASNNRDVSFVFAEYVDIPENQPTDLILSGCTGGADNTYHIGVMDRTGTAFENWNNDTSMGNVTNNAYHTYYIRVRTHTTVDTEFYPMVRLSSAPAGYEPPYYPNSGKEIESGLLITSIDGLGPSKASINMSEYAAIDGQSFNSARLSGRNIVIHALYSDVNNSIEEARLLSYKMFPIKSKVKIKAIADNRTVETEGYVESNEPDIFSKRSGCQISILCEDAYFDGDKIEQQMPCNIEYTGDTNSGVQLEIGLPTDDIMDEFEVTSMTITKNDEIISIDIPKMANMVPNTMPYNLSVANCSLIYEDSSEGSRYKFFQKIPQKSSQSAIPGLEFGTAFVYHNEIYIIGVSGYDSIFKWDGTKWIEAIQLPVYEGNKYSYSNVYHVVIFNDQIHLIGGVDTYSVFVRCHFAYDDVNKTWRRYNDLPINCEYGVVVAYSDGIHYINEDHYIWPNLYAQDAWRQAEAPWCHFTDGCAVTYHDYIYLFGGDVVDGCCYKWNGVQTQGGSYWIRTGYPSESLRGCKAAVYNDKIHVFGGEFIFNTSDTAKAHYTYDDTTNTWTRDATELPYPFRDGGVVYLDNHIYILGSSYGVGTGQYYGSTYSEEPNNIKMIENDKIVINTNKGHKSVTLHRNNAVYNILNTLEPNPSWFELQRGENKFTYNAIGDTGDLEIIIKANTKYQGV